MLERGTPPPGSRGHEPCQRSQPCVRARGSAGRKELDFARGRNALKRGFAAWAVRFGRSQGGDRSGRALDWCGLQGASPNAEAR